MAQGSGGSSQDDWEDEGSSRAVVQPLPPAGSSDLNNALLRLARNGEDVDALVDAGNASLRLNDLDAAIGFFSRADRLRPGNARAKAGLGAAFVRSENPYDALLMFDEAEKAGAPVTELAGDRGLAHDLVGDNAGAQVLYRQALTRGPNEEVTRRLALSLAISGDRNGAEAALRPLLDRRDLAAYRTRAFALAILGDTKEAQSIADVRLPRDVAQRMGPYLRYMPRLTAAQQAAAANFGQFPKAADIGHDDPRIAARSGANAKTADSALIPRGEPLGGRPSAGSRDDKQRGDRQKSRGKEDTRIATNTLAGSENPPAAVSPPPPAQRPAAPPVAASSQRPTYGPSLSIAEAEARPQPQPQPKPVPQQIAPAAVARTPAPAAPMAQAPTPAAPPPPPAPPAPRSVAEAFADFALPPAPAQPDEGAVDVTRITPRREGQTPAKAEPAESAPTPQAVDPAKAKAEAARAKAEAAKARADKEKADKLKAEKAKADKEKAEKAKNPSRLWVQVGTGRDKDALAFDWRRNNKNEPKLFKGRSAHVAAWGRTNRLLVGPFPNDKAAKSFMEDVKKAKIDAFTFTSDAGEVVDPLGK